MITQKTILLCICLNIFCIAEAQDIVINNASNDQPLYLLDTTFTVVNQKLNVVVGPEKKMPQNTIFFNRLWAFTKDQFENFKIKGAFHQRFEVRESRFNLPVIIDSTSFDTLLIQKSVFLHPVTFKNIEVQHFYFNENTVPVAIRFENCKFKDCFIEGSTLQAFVQFDHCSFENISFAHSELMQSLDLGGINVTGKVNFDGVIFHQNLNLSGQQNGPSTSFSFYNTTLPEILDFSYNNLTNPVDFTKTVSLKGRKCKILLNNIGIEKIQMNYSAFKLVFGDGVSHDDKQKIYEQLLGNFKSQAYQDSYRLLDIEYKRYQAKSGTLGFLWWIPEYWWNYGYNKEYVFYWVFWLLFVFTCINYFALQWLLGKTYKLDNFPKVDPQKYGTRLWYSFVLTSIIFFSLSLKIDKLKLNNKGGTLYIMLIYTLGLVCLAYMANFVIQK